MLKRLGVPACHRWRHSFRTIWVLIVVFLGVGGAASGLIPADCDTARDRAKSK